MARWALDYLDASNSFFLETKDIACRMKAMLDIREQFLLIRLLSAEHAQIFASLVALVFQFDHGLGRIAGCGRTIGIEFSRGEISAEILGSPS